MSGAIWTSSFLLTAVLATGAGAVTCEDVSHLGQSYTVCAVDAAAEDLSLHHADRSGNIIGNFDALDKLHPDRSLAFAMNAGMYHEDRSPVGLYQQDGTITSHIVTSAGPGNFGLVPNGVLCLTDTRAQVYETLAYVNTTPTCRDASQSGPMLVINSQLHPRFIPGGTSKHIRNGVGTSADGHTAIFAISNEPVNFHDFGTLFRDHLQTPNALYFDGSISRLYAPQMNRDDFGFQLGPMIAVFE